MRFGVIGMGAIGELHAAVISELADAALVAISSRNEEKVGKLAAKFNADGHTDYCDLIKRDDVDVVCICTASGTHADIGLDCLKAGKHILVEKPIDISLAKVDRMIEEADARGLKIGCIFQLRFFADSHKTKKAIEDGRLGRIVLGDAYMKFHRDQGYYDNASWKGTLALDGGGALMNQGIHGIDLLQWLMGDVESVCAAADTLAHENIAVEDTAVAVLRFRSGAMGVIEGATSVYPDIPQRLEIHGTKGTIVLEGTEFTSIRRWQTTDGSVDIVREAAQHIAGPEAVAELGGKGHRIQIQDMIGAIREDRKPLVDGLDGRQSLEIVLAIYKSAREEKIIHLPLAP